MDNIQFIILFFQLIPESIAMTFLSISLLGVWTINKKNLLFVFGTLEGIFIFMLKSLSLSFGVHTIVAIFSIALWIYLITKRSFIYCILSSAVATIILVILELIVVGIFVNIIGIELSVILETISLRILIGLPQIIALYLFGVILNKVIWNKKSNPFTL